MKFDIKKELLSIGKLSLLWFRITGKLFYKSGKIILLFAWVVLVITGKVLKALSKKQAANTSNKKKDKLKW